MYKKFIFIVISVTMLWSSVHASGDKALVNSNFVQPTSIQEGDSITHITYSGTAEKIYTYVQDTLFEVSGEPKTTDPIWWIPCYRNNDTLIVRSKDLATIPFPHDTIVWNIQPEQGRIYLYDAKSVTWDHQNPTVLQHGTAKIPTMDRQKKRPEDTASLLLIAITLLILAEGLLGLWLLWKLCRKSKVVSNRTRKEKRARIQQYVNLLELLEAKDTLSAIKNLQPLLANSKILQQLQTDPTQFKRDNRFKVLNTLLTEREEYREENKKLTEKIDILVQDSLKLLENPISVLSNKSLNDKELSQIMHDLDLLQEHQKSSAKIGPTQLKSDLVKKAVLPSIQDAQSSTQFKIYKPYFKNIISAIHRDFHKLQNEQETDNTRTLLMYLAQLYSISVTMYDLLDHQEAFRQFNDEDLASHRENTTPFCKKIANLEDISSVKNKGRKFQYVGAKNEQNLIDYLKKYEPLDFNLLGTHYQNYLSSKK